MSDESFGKQDDSFMKGLKNEREKKVPSAYLKGFSASVESKIRERQPSLEVKFKPRRSWVPVWAPVFAVLVIASVFALRLPLGPAPQPIAAVVSDISDEIAVLGELGVWTEEDENAIAAAPEAAFEDLDLANTV